MTKHVSYIWVDRRPDGQAGIKQYAAPQKKFFNTELTYRLTSGATKLAV